MTDANFVVAGGQLHARRHDILPDPADPGDVESTRVHRAAAVPRHVGRHLAAAAAAGRHVVHRRVRRSAVQRHHRRRSAH